MGFIADGINQANIDYSLDGTIWSHLGQFDFLQAPGTDNYPGFSGPSFGGINARYVLISAISNFGGSCYGLSEIRFDVNDNSTCHTFDIAAKVFPASCSGGNNGKIELIISGGQSPFIYNWSNGGMDSIISSLSTGSYSVTITDFNNCIEAITLYIDEYDQDTSNFNQVPIPSKAYYQDGLINSQGLVSYNGLVSFVSAQGISVHPGFEVVNGGDWLAEIGDCNNIGSEEGEYFIWNNQDGGLKQYSNYVGAGNHKGLVVSTSNNSNGHLGYYTIGGQGLSGDTSASSRFLAQATLGANYEMIVQLDSMGYSDWIEWQCSVSPQSYMTSFDSVISDVWVDPGNGKMDFRYFRMAWWQNALTGQDYLRDRIAWALSEIFVVSDKSSLSNFGEGLASYYDVLHGNSLENFRDILFGVSMHPSMGLYLSHLNNPKSDTSKNQYPDENYSREFMQLFSIGLNELNEDGSLKKNVYGNEISTYDNDDIIEYAKIFTGLGFDADSAKFGSQRWYDYTVPMIMYEGHHEPGQKFLLQGEVVPSGQTGMQDINQAIDNIFNHPNVGPFICRRLIQRTVKSNPSPEYLKRVSSIFSDNGQGARGDMKAVIKAILMDPEARNCDYDDPTSGYMVEPLIRLTQYLRVFDAQHPSDKFYIIGNAYAKSTFQTPLSSPSVFNFFQPDYVPPGPARDQNLYGPEFQILNSFTSLAYFNEANKMKNNRLVVDSAIDSISVDFSDELAIALDADKLVDRLDLLLTHGSLSSNSKSIIKKALLALAADPKTRLEMAIYLFFTCAEYIIFK